MSTFAFRAVDLAGIPSRGEVEAESKAHVTEDLRQRGLIVLDVSEKREALKLESLLDRFRRMSARDLAVSSRQFATLIESGMPMLRALHTLEDQTENEMLEHAVASVRKDIEAGSSLAQAMERHPKVFDKLYTSLVRSGESSGQLESALDRIAYQLEKLDALRRQIRSATMYPAFVFVFAVAVLMAVVAFIVPTFVGVFEDIAESTPGVNSELPTLTQITVGASDVITGSWYILFPAIAALVVGFLRFKKTELGRAWWDRLKLKIPAHIGDVVHKVALARWSRTLSGAVSAGVPLLQAIRVTGETAGNAQIEAAMDEVYDSVKQGGTIAAPLANSPLFPPMVSHMVAVGEETGQLDQMLGKIADFYEAEVDAKVKALTALIEPLMIIFVGAVVGFIVISMYLPMIEIYNNIR
ncbi:MAG: type II secretion system F family protein [Solirubrobacterales bacterium]